MFLSTKIFILNTCYAFDIHKLCLFFQYNYIHQTVQRKNKKIHQFFIVNNLQ